MKLYLIRGVLENIKGTKSDTKGLAEKALVMVDEVERLATIGNYFDEAAKCGRPIKTVPRYSGDKNPVKFIIRESDIKTILKESEDKPIEKKEKRICAIQR